MCNWKALRDQLAVSAWLAPDDDLTTQRGIVATALAITQRMSDETRNVSWRPVRLAAKPVTLQSDLQAQSPYKPGNMPVQPSPVPRRPLPGGIAVRPVDSFAIGG